MYSADIVLSNNVLEALSNISKASTYVNQDRYQGKDGLIYCAKCNTPLQSAINFGGKILNMPVPCSCQSLEYQQQEAVLKQQQHEVTVRQLKDDGFNNSYYLSCTFDKDDLANPEVSRVANAYVQKFDRFYSKGLGILFQGTCGNGKTFISACIGNALISKEYSVYMTTISDLVNLMSKDYGNYMQDVIQKISNVDLLILDDLGTENILDTKNSKTIEYTYKIVDTRYLSNKPMIISTNLNVGSLVQDAKLDINLRRIFERILQKCKPYTLSTVNRRKSQSHANSDIFNSILEANVC